MSSKCLLSCYCAAYVPVFAMHLYQALGEIMGNYNVPVMTTSVVALSATVVSINSVEYPLVCFVLFFDGPEHRLRILIFPLFPVPGDCAH